MISACLQVLTQHNIYVLHLGGLNVYTTRIHSASNFFLIYMLVYIYILNKKLHDIIMLKILETSI